MTNPNGKRHLPPTQMQSRTAPTTTALFPMRRYTRSTFTWAEPRTSTAIEAMRENKTLIVTYQSFTMKLPREFEIMPYCLRCFKQRWYILGKKRGDKEPHFFSLDRVLDMEITPLKFKLPENFDADSFFYNYYGVMQGDTPVEAVQLRVTPFYANYLRSLPLHHSQKETERTDEYSVLEYHLAPTSDFIQELRSFLPEILVLQPLWLRNKFIDEAKEILENYKYCK